MSVSIFHVQGGLIVWYVGGRDVIGNSMTLGELIAFLAYLGMFYAPLGALSNFTSWLTSFMTGSKRVLELLDTPLTVAENLNPKPWLEPRGDIRFEDVSFGYDRNQPGQLIEQGTHAHLLSIDGTYARLIRIQTSVSKDPNVDRLLQVTEANLVAIAEASSVLSHDSSTATALLDGPPEDETPEEEPKAQALRWLEPVETQFLAGENDRVELWIDGERICSSVFIVRTFKCGLRAIENRSNRCSRGDTCFGELRECTAPNCSSDISTWTLKRIWDRTALR